MAGIMTTPIATAVATAAPEIAAKMAQASTVARPSPPLMWPSSVRANRTRSGVSPPSFMRFPASMNSGMASSGNVASPPKIVWIRVVIGAASPTRAYTRAQPPSATVIGAETHSRMMKALTKRIIGRLLSARPRGRPGTLPG